MGLRCIIGHDYGDPERTETREQRGDERVVTVREYRECARCGHQQVISENTEVRSTEEPSPETPGDGEAADATEETEAGADDPEYDDVSAEEDDGVILDEEDAEPERERGEWPDAEAESEESGEPEDWPEEGRETAPDADDPEEDDWPTPEGEDEGFEAEPASAGGPEEDVDFGGGLTPEESGGSTEGEGETVESVREESTPGSGDASTGIRRSDPGPSPTTQQRPAEPDTVFACPNCEYTTPAPESSLRPGDICPECSRGYLTEREDA